MSLGLAAALVSSIASTRSHGSEADRSAALQEVSARTIDLLASVENERGLGHLLLSRPGEQRRRGYIEATESTDRVLVQHAGTVERLRSRLDPAAGDDEIALALSQLPAIRERFIDGSAVQSDLLYSSVIRPVREWLADQAFSTTSIEEVRLRRANNALLAAFDAAGRRRVLVMSALDGDELTQELLIELSIVQHEFLSNVAQAATLVQSVPVADGVEMGQAVGGLVDAELSRVVRRSVEAVLSEAPAQALPTVATWFDDSSHQMDNLVRLIEAVNDEIGKRVADDAASVARQGRQLGALFTALFLLSLVAGGSAIVTSRQRLAALQEYEELEAGVRNWFLPETLPDVDGLDFVARYQPAASHAESGGDWYDAVLMEDGGVLLVIGDVAGHSPTTVSHMVEVRNILRGVASATNEEPAKILELVDRTSRAGRFATVFLARLSSDLRSITFSRGGHMPAILRRADGSAVLLEGESDLPIGVDPAAPRRQETTPLGAGDVLVLFTDGLVDRPNGYLPDEIEALRSAVEGHDEDAPLDALADRLMTSRDPSSSDDCSLFVARCGVHAGGDTAADARRDAASGGGTPTSRAAPSATGGSASARG